MNIRAATDDDRREIEEIAQRSFWASYVLGPAKVEAILDEQFASEALRRRIDDPHGQVLVAEDTATNREFSLLGFGEIDDEATLRWLHVRPKARGRGLGRSLVERLKNESDTESNQFTARSLQSAREGGPFLERFSLYVSESDPIEVGGESFTAQLYTQQGH